MKWLMLILCLANPAAAKDAALSCVQAQLSALRYDVGAIDGVWGRRTQAAGKAFADAMEASEPLPQLTRYNAAVLCRQLGLRNNFLRQFWPAGDEAYRLTTSRDVSSNMRVGLEVSAEKALQRFQEIFGLQLSQPINLVAATSRENLRQLWKDALGSQYKAESFNVIYAQSCRRKNETGGFATGNLVAICLQPGPAGATDKWLIDMTVAHEMFHAAQRQLAGMPAPKQSADTIAYAGPEWLIEGSATYVSVRSVMPQSLIRPSFEQLRSKIGKAQVDLRRLDTFQARQTQLESLYDNGTYAAFMLTERAGSASMVRFYELIGFGMPWQDAFATAFGEDPSEFYVRYKNRELTAGVAGETVD